MRLNSELEFFTKIFCVFSIIFSLGFDANAGFFSEKKGRTFQTRDTALIYRSGSLTVGIERRNIPIPAFFDIESTPSFIGLTHDGDSGWTKCRVPLDDAKSITGAVERSLVFDCKPLTFYK